MSEVAKKQHYVWRYYLSPWTDDKSVVGKIVCLRKNKIFISSLKNVAHENYFYETKPLTKQEKEFICYLTMENASDIQKIVGKGWLEIYCAPFDFDDLTAPLFSSLEQQYKEEKEKIIRDMVIGNIEMLHGIIESIGTPYLDQLRQDDISFWKNKEDRDKFSFYLSIQYFRTKRNRDALKKVFEQIPKEVEYLKNIRPDNIWIPLTLIYASNLGVCIADNYSAVLLQSDADSFIVGDQPIVNTYFTFDMFTVPNDVELFYPITPKSGLLLTMDSQYVNGEVRKINADEVKKYNSIEFKMSMEQVFAKDRMQLECFME